MTEPNPQGPVNATERRLVEVWAKWQEAKAASDKASAAATSALRTAYRRKLVSQRRAAKLLNISVSAVRDRLGLRKPPPKKSHEQPEAAPRPD